ncbi:type IV pilus biogenesis protein PilM [Vibrio gazogenes]|uniref:Type IV pilus assembly protein PilM n=1 Tax=Vibrio gazogenes DSM 21264 = NBRC 103151 TaxID=1123492 RepID=A0A1M5BFK9_VIBGA|nr:pilus assembly protein PilM [Vibrio gazogenes]USP14005.1 pilus assembly protein PilM [Vibrio gazogenes]SHF41236.1 type IV pilus assembly protein PilM [Vibrio gazogenes DSM 21264] [Vibrio gazogenes DSM 21264 = NBRC 103151]SJN57736.1 Competence protein A [Vibrio gazogenes]
MRKRIVTGIDIRRHRMTTVTLKRQHNIVSLLDCETLSVPDGIFSENEVIDYQSIVNKLAEIRKRLPFLQNRVAISMPDLAVMTKTVEPSIGDYDKSLAPWLIAQAFSEKTGLSGTSVYLDYVPLETGYQVYAAKKEVVESRLQALCRAGLKPVLIDTEKQAFLQFLLESMCRAQRQRWLLIDIGEDIIAIGFITDELSFYRQFPFSSQAFDAAHTLVLQEVQRFMSLYPAALLNGIWVNGSPSMYQMLSQSLCQQFQGPIEHLEAGSVFDTSVSIPAHLSPFIPLAAGSALRGLMALEAGYAA